MKKKLFAAIAAGTMLCGMLTANVSAAETSYQMGDVNMDGAVDTADAQIVLVDYTQLICRKKGILTDEQRILGNVDGVTEFTRSGNIEIKASICDAQMLLRYYVVRLSKSDMTLEEVVGRTFEAEQAYLETLERYRFYYDEERERFVAEERK